MLRLCDAAPLKLVEDANLPRMPQEMASVQVVSVPVNLRYQYTKLPVPERVARAVTPRPLPENSRRVSLGT